MIDIPYHRALIVGAGPGLSASLARRLTAAGVRVALAARNIAKLSDLAEETGAIPIWADSSDPASVAALFAEADAVIGEPDLVIYNASARVRGRIAELDPELVRGALEVSAFGGFLVAREAARRMTPHQQGAILFTGATASIKGFPLSAAFAMGKFALRGLAQSASRELGPHGIHVAHIVVDGGIRSAARPVQRDRPDSLLDPDGVAQAYIDLLRQPRNAWTFELDLRPWTESF